ncbi:hypothetical protein BDV39DRAFT_198806 [Aspergillus sergii]|uniref:Uncharacterized protein n=1 Tax=Aspergillus sergii TaxID=1034303 RepID=A0A5N6XNF2_9EURO|nr:hypothetical protein BDV39DRAFT_198806 [Aspergillus sergii]
MALRCLNVLQSVVEDEEYKPAKLPTAAATRLAATNSEKLSKNENFDESLNGTAEKYVSKDEDYWNSDLHDTDAKEVPWPLLKQYIKYIFEATSDIIKALDINENFETSGSSGVCIYKHFTALHPASLFGYVRMAELLDLREDPAKK